MIKARCIRYDLKFNFRAGTSRGFLTDKTSWFIILRDGLNHRVGIGECGPLKGLSLDDRPDIEDQLTTLCRSIEKGPDPGINDLESYLNEQVPSGWPSLKMGLETALRDLFNGGRRIIFNNGFIAGSKIPINGLIWMGDRKFLIDQVERKKKEGYRCIKMKIGAIDFQSEVEILKYIIKSFEGREFSIRVDANGAFSYEEALKKLEILAALGLHSIEQPIPPGNPDLMAGLCRRVGIPIALDEELIGGYNLPEKKEMLEYIRPAFIVIKPTLIGGFAEARQWISLAEGTGIGWWITSALESNIGLNAIAQFTLENRITMEQGLGTGQLFHNNIPSPLKIDQGNLKWDIRLNWDLRDLGIDEMDGNAGDQSGSFGP
jgi:o-succinylbenzoate synthase